MGRERLSLGTHTPGQRRGWNRCIKGALGRRAQELCLSPFVDFSRLRRNEFNRPRNDFSKAV